ATLTFGFYLIHALILDVFNKILVAEVFQTSLSNWWILPAQICLTFGGTYLLVIIFQKVPILKKMV
ncbi:MAG: hypothetical protein AAF193_08265, partial [Bacteroidota bacterium]